MKTQIHPLLHDLLAGLLSGLVALTPATAAESVPPLINYQGALTDANGAPMAGVKSMEFRLYDHPTAAEKSNLIWGPQIYATVPLIGGKFNVLLGPTDSSGQLITTAFADKTRYLSITIGGKEILPRQQILSTPYAMQAQESNHAKDADHSLDGSLAIQKLSALEPQVDTLKKRVVFGGIYQVDEINPSGHHVNPFTGTLGCPVGYQSVEFARVHSAVTGGCCGSRLNFCFSQN